ncbi:hypothetical protein ATDW_26120 [Asticcacaulis sp. DW145]|uniref:hypothetical protein n=1 Tax=Asticcacaulis sp. DW145 TaxID=3095608 RepID=UPI00308E102F|nr:hypothetical protein ATDW_26120 [Asticcacaulis sp. DW145]
MKTVNAIRLSGVLVLMASVVNATPDDTPRTKIKIVEVGWSDPNIRLFVEGNVYNPDGCSNPNSYIIDASLPSRDAMLSLALTAYSLNQDVNFIVDGCSFGSPRIITMRIRKD